MRHSPAQSRFLASPSTATRNCASTAIVVSRRRNPMNPVPWTGRGAITQGCSFQPAETRPAYGAICAAAVVACHSEEVETARSRDLRQHGPRDSLVSPMRLPCERSQPQAWKSSRDASHIDCWQVAHISSPLQAPNQLFASNSIRRAWSRPFTPNTTHFALVSTTWP